MSNTAELRAQLRTLARARVFFSHQSVGGNVLDGLAELGREAGAGLNVVPFDLSRSSSGPGLVHAFGGENGRPGSKLEFFESAMTALAEAPPEIALMKFCYVDFTPDTEVEGLLARYSAALERLAKRHPSVLFVHVTVPLTTHPTGLKAHASRLIGRRVWQDAANERRNLFNERLRATFEGQVVFDLARVESTRPDGSAEMFRGGGRDYAALYPLYAVDDGHLNEQGRRAAAADLARVLASTVITRRARS